MPKPLLHYEPQNRTEENILSLNKNEPLKLSENDKLKIDRALRKKRSKEYIKAIQKLDAGGHVTNQKEINDIIEIIKNELPEVTLDTMLKGIVSKCYLGDDYEVHTLSIAGDIIVHYKRGQTMDADLEKARSIAMYGGYEFIEVYADCCRAVDSSGNVSVIVC